MTAPRGFHDHTGQWHDSLAAAARAWGVSLGSLSKHMGKLRDPTKALQRSLECKALGSVSRGRVPANARAIVINGREYPSITAAERELGVSRRAIDRRLARDHCTAAEAMESLVEERARASQAPRKTRRRATPYQPAPRRTAPPPAGKLAIDADEQERAKAVAAFIRAHGVTRIKQGGWSGETVEDRASEQNRRRTAQARRGSQVQQARPFSRRLDPGQGA